MQEPTHVPPAYDKGRPTDETITAPRPAPLDIAQMRANARKMLSALEPLPVVDDMRLLGDALRGHLALLMDELRPLVASGEDEDPQIMAARVALEDAELTYRMQRATRGPLGLFRTARAEARRVVQLASHYETLTRSTSAVSL